MTLSDFKNYSNVTLTYNLYISKIFYMKFFFMSFMHAVSKSTINSKLFLFPEPLTMVTFSIAIFKAISTAFLSGFNYHVVSLTIWIGECYFQSVNVRNVLGRHLYKHIALVLCHCGILKIIQNFRNPTNFLLAESFM